MVRPPATNPKTTMLSCQIDAALAQALVDEARKRDVPKSQIMRDALRAYLSKRKGVK